MHAKKRLLSLFFLLALIVLGTMAANCPGCLLKKDCAAFDGDKAACEKGENCRFVKETGKCSLQLPPKMSGCLDIQEEAPCRASSNCFFDEAARTCLEAPGKNACDTIKNETACNADKNCHWQADIGGCVIK